MQRHEFVTVAQNAAAGLGFAPELAMVRFPVSLFLAESDLTPIKQNINGFIDALTKWKPSVSKKGIVMPPKVTITGKNYEDALAKMNSMFLMNSWADGLPLVPATAERMKWILRGTDLPKESVVGSGKILPRGGIATVEVVAAALAMAGGRPEYLPVLLATVEAMIDPGLGHQNWQATTCSIFPTAVVNGSVGRDIRLNHTWGLIGPNAKYPAGAAIGRALRLLQQNVGGAVPGVGTMAQFGGMRYTNAIFAEDEAGLPEGWKPLSEDRFGLPKDTNLVTLYPVSSATNILRRGTGKFTAEEEAEFSLQRVASYMLSLNANTYEGYYSATPGILVIPTTVAKQLASLGWTREKIRQYLWDNTKTPKAVLEKSGIIEWMFNYGVKPEDIVDPCPITAKPENFMIVVAGGSHPTHNYWMQGAQGPKVTNAKVTLPAKWAELLKEAEQDLGPMPK